MPVNFSVKHELLSSKEGVTVTRNDLQYPKCQTKLSNSSFCLVSEMYLYFSSLPGSVRSAGFHSWKLESQI